MPYKHGSSADPNLMEFRPSSHSNSVIRKRTQIVPMNVHTQKISRAQQDMRDRMMWAI